jgi:integrase
LAALVDSDSKPGSLAGRFEKGHVMSEVFRPSYTVTDPETGEKRKRKSRRWWIRYYDPAGQRHKVKGYKDLKATQALATELEKRAQRLAAGLADPLELHAKKPLLDHLAEYVRYLGAKGDTANHVALTEMRIKSALDGCRFVRIADLQPSTVVSFLADLRRPRQSPDGKELPGKSITTANYYLTAIKGFTRWLWKDRRTTVDPLAGMSKLAHAENDVRHARRMLEPSELRELLTAARGSDKALYYLAGPDRFMIYATSIYTGFRAKELHSLNPEDFDLDGSPPTIRVQSDYSKNRKEVVQPIPRDLADALRGYLTGKPAGQPLWPGRWYRRAAEILRHDLEAAGIPYVTEAGFADFHSLRHDYVSMLTASGASPKVAQELARHSTVQLTLGRYAHTGLYDLAAAVNDAFHPSARKPISGERRRPAGHRNGRGHSSPGQAGNPVKKTWPKPWPETGCLGRQTETN